MDANPISACKTVVSQIIWRASLKPWPCWSQCNSSMCWVRSGFFWKPFTVAKMTAVRKRDGFLSSGKGKPPNPLGKQVVLKYKIMFLCINTLLKYTTSTKRHQFHFFINNPVRDLWGKHTALGKVSVNRTDVESCKRLIWRLYSQCISGIHVNSVSKFY